MRKALRRSGLTIAALAVAFLATTIPLAPPAMVAAVAEEEAGPARAPSISTVTARIDEIVETALVTGTLVAREEIVVGVDIQGLKIVGLLADAGDMVEAGDVLARLDGATIDIQLAQNTSQLARATAAIAQARASIAEAEAARIQADAALSRTEDLTGRGVTAQEALDQATAASASAAARFTSAEQGLELALADKALIEAQRREIELQRAKTEIKAPTGGLVLSRTARIGAVASAAAEPLFRIAQGGLIELDAEIAETNLARLEEGMAVAVTPTGFAAPVEGEIRLISPEIDRASRLGGVRVALPKEEGLRAGSFARGLVEIDRSRGVTVPVSALVATDGSTTVQTVVDGRIETREVETGLREGDRIEIVSGLAEGETVVRRAGSFVRDGDPVTAVAEISQEAAR